MADASRGLLRRGLKAAWRMARLRSRFVVDRPGFCPVCERNTRFRALDPWLRDHLRCRRCASVPRERALLHVLNLVAPDWREASVHESSPGNSASRKLMQEAGSYLPSQYDPGVPRGEWDAAGAFRSEDLERQTFEDESFDIVVTQDVFEHLFRPDQAIAEIARTLKPGGMHICTVPLLYQSGPSVRRAAREADGVRHFAEPVHHTDVQPTGGSLVTVDWGYDIAAFFAHHAGMPTVIHHVHDAEQGILGALTEVVVSWKAPGSPGDAPKP